MARTLFKDFSFQVEAGERVAIIGPNGIGKTTLLRYLWSTNWKPGRRHRQVGGEAAEPGYYAQDHASDFAEESDLFDWIGQLEAKEGEQWFAGPWAACCSPTTRS